MTIDSHQHFWKYDPLNHQWIDDEMAAIRKDFLPTHLKKVYDEHKIDGCVAVQVDQTLKENDFMLNLAKENDFIKGVVGWVDLRSKKVDEVLEGYANEDKLKGFRHIVQGEADPNFMVRPDFMNGISRLEKGGFTYDILVFPHQLGSALELVGKFPRQKFVVDHIAKPYIKDGFFEGWSVLMKELSRHENVYCKLSGMITEADYRHWTPDQIHPYMYFILEAFGAERIMFGSDWPVCLVAGSYGEVLKLVTDFIAPLSSYEQNAIMGQNAIQFYNLF